MPAMFLIIVSYIKCICHPASSDRHLIHMRMSTSSLIPLCYGSSSSVKMFEGDVEELESFLLTNMQSVYFLRSDAFSKPPMYNTWFFRSTSADSFRSVGWHREKEGNHDLVWKDCTQVTKDFMDLHTENMWEYGSLWRLDLDPKVKVIRNKLPIDIYHKVVQHLITDHLVIYNVKELGKMWERLPDTRRDAVEHMIACYNDPETKYKQSEPMQFGVEFNWEEGNAYAYMLQFHEMMQGKPYYVLLRNQSVRAIVTLKPDGITNFAVIFYKTFEGLFGLWSHSGFSINTGLTGTNFMDDRGYQFLDTIGPEGDQEFPVDGPKLVELIRTCLETRIPIPLARHIRSEDKYRYLFVEGVMLLQMFGPKEIPIMKCLWCDKNFR